MKNLFKALAGFQQEVPTIHQGTKGYGYTYSNLNTIFKVINPILKKYELGFTQLIEGNSIKTIIFHSESGESLESITEIPQGVTLKGMNTFQVNGSGITYYRRYSLSSALGLVTDVDSDATGEEIKKTDSQIAEEYNNSIKTAKANLKASKDLNSLVKAWGRLTVDQKNNKEVTELKDSLKVKHS
tara:strand:- start:824 stop:1378 length:555 start_codon:yes stop_codon:yes gene_type:complete